RQSLERVVAERRACADQPCQFVRVAVGLQESDHQLARRSVVFVADTHRAEQYLVSRILRHKRSDALPQQQQRLIAFLILQAHKRPAQFQRRADTVQEPSLVGDERTGIESLVAKTTQDLIGLSKPVCSGNLLLLAVPKEEMQIVSVEAVDVDLFTRTLSGLPESDLAQT